VISLDVNVLLYAHRQESAHHDRAAAIVRAAAVSTEPLGLSDVALLAVVRIATNPRLYALPSSHDQVFGFVEALRARDNATIIAPGPAHWALFERLCRHSDARANLVTDAWFAALALEHDCEWVSFDRDFAKFPGLRWRNPADEVEAG
jgi:toxin-antitoxin system PIN domain toxin